MVARSRAREGRGLSVAPEAQIEPEIETRPEKEITTCEEGLGAARPFPADTGSLFTFSDKPEIATVYTSHRNQSFLSSHIPSLPSSHWFPTGYHLAGMSATSADISRADILPPQLSYYGDMPIAGSFAPARAPICDTTVVPLSA